MSPTPKAGKHQPPMCPLSNFIHFSYLEKKKKKDTNVRLESIMAIACVYIFRQLVGKTSPSYHSVLGKNTNGDFITSASKAINHVAVCPPFASPLSHIQRVTRARYDCLFSPLFESSSACVGYYGGESMIPVAL
jgi:hypothetical protein